jgi:hypothetical protein
LASSNSNSNSNSSSNSNSNSNNGTNSNAYQSLSVLAVSPIVHRPHSLHMYDHAHAWPHSIVHTHTRPRVRPFVHWQVCPSNRPLNMPPRSLCTWR